MNVNLRCTVPWISSAAHFVLMNNGHTFPIQIDPTHLPTGSGAHYGEVLGFDAACEARGPIFRVPVTVIRPISVSDSPTDEKVPLR